MKTIKLSKCYRLRQSVAVALFAVATPFANAAVSVFEHNNYQGYGVALSAGKYTLSDLMARGIKNDDLSSFRVPTGFTLQLFEHDNFKGRVITLTKDTSGFSSAADNDIASSVVVVKAPSENSVTVYQHYNYQGYSAKLPAGKYRLADLAARGVKNDDLSSAKVPAGITLKLYEHDNFTGRVTTLTKDNSGFVVPSLNDTTSSLDVATSGTTPTTPPPPSTWQEHWFDHNQVVKNVFYDDHAAIYHDNNMEQQSTVWLNKMVSDAWRYTKQVYGQFGKDGHLFAIFHQNRYSGGHPSTYFDAHHDYRNVIDLGTNTPWYENTGWNVTATIHEIAHIVEGSAYGVHGSPTFGLWRDSKWAEIYVYDVLRNIGMSGEADKIYQDLQDNRDDFPRANSYWFRDWYYPVYRDYGGSRVLSQYFKLLSERFPKNGNSYSRDLNWGEYIHFMSGAAGRSLKYQATHAFGWPTEWENQWQKARRDFPLNYVD